MGLRLRPMARFNLLGQSWNSQPDRAPRAEVTKAVRARKNEKMQRCEAIRQQHEQLRRGDGAHQSSSSQVGMLFSDTIFSFYFLVQEGATDSSRPTLSVAFRTGSRTRTGTGEEAGTGGRRCRASPSPRARAATASSLNPPPANATDRTVPSGRCFLSFFFLLGFLFAC
jgi:hypothetical protein